MQITATKETLMAPLALVAGAADTRGTIPVLGSVLLKTTDDGKLAMVCSDTAVLARSLTAVDVRQAGEIAVDVRRLHDLIRVIPDKQQIEIDFEAEKQILRVKAGRSRFRLPTFAAEDYPRMTPEKEDRLSITMDAQRLARMISDVAASMPCNDVRYYLNGAFFVLDQAGFWIVTTDGHRMTVSHEPIAGADGLALRSVIVPRKTVLLAKKLLSQGSSVTLTIGAKNIQLTFGDGSVLFGNAIDGKYPDWRSVLPDSTGQVTIPAAPLGNAIDMLMASDDISDKNESRINQINVCVAPTGTTLRRGETGLCEIGSETASGSTQELAFNIRFLADAVETVRTAGSSDIVIGYTSAEKAIAVRPKDRDFPLVVVMPLRP